MAGATQFLGSKISLISKAEIRYEGILYALNVKDATISLAKVRAYGTEDRPTETPVAPKEEVFESIIFRGTDIKCIDVLEAPKTATSSAVPNDPAIIGVSQYRRQQGRGGRSTAGTPQRQNQSVIQDLLRQGRQVEAASSETSGQGQRSSSGRNQNTASVIDESTRSQSQGRGNRRNGNQTQSGFRGGNNTGNTRGDGGGDGLANTGRRGGYNFSPRRGWIMSRMPFPRRPQGQLRAPQTAKVTFDHDFDFEKSHEELVTKMKELQLNPVPIADSTGENKYKEGENEVPEAVGGNEAQCPEQEEQESKEPQVFYKKDDFWDAISCEALEREKGTVISRADWRKEFKLNAETFGLSGQRRGFNYGGRGNRNGFYGGRGFRWTFYTANAPRNHYNRYNNGPARLPF